MNRQLLEKPSKIWENVDILNLSQWKEKEIARRRKGFYRKFVVCRNEKYSDILE